MPGVEGIEVLERIQARKSPTRFFIMTAVHRPDIAARSTRAGAAEFITKLFELSRIEGSLRDLSRETASGERPYRPEEKEEQATYRIVGKSRAIIDVFKKHPEDGRLERHDPDPGGTPSAAGATRRS